MLDKLLKKRTPTPNGVATGAKPAKAKNNTKPTSKPIDAIGEEEWRNRLATAVDNDADLLAIAKQTVSLTIKQAAIDAMTTEAGLKAAEREFRSHDRRIYREAKLRYEGKVTERLARAEATSLIAQCNQLLLSDPIPANRFVDIDRAWQRLDSARLTADMINEYRGVSAQLTSKLRARGDQQLSFKRWRSDAERAHQELTEGCLAVAQSGMDRDKLAKLYDHIESLRGQGALLPSAETPRLEVQQREIDYTQAQLDSALQLARALDARLTFLDKLIADITLETRQSAASDDGSVNARWQMLPIANDARVAKALNDRFDAYRRTENAARSAVTNAAASADAEATTAAKQAERAAFETLLEKAETTLAAGQIIESTASLAALDLQLKKHKMPTKLLSRVEHVRAEVARLKGWQHWGGGRVREDLVVEAETLSKAITDIKLNIKAHANAIEQLRERWKELDKLGGATNRELWLRFDGALKHAYLPVDAQLAKLKAMRQENLQSRNTLVAKLAEEANTIIAAVPPDWRAATRALDHFQTEWRKLGPVEHTVPHKAQKALLEKMQSTQAMLESPLAEARRVEAAKREKLVEQAKALAADSNQRDTIAKVRALQADWQQHARSLPLARQQENRLWADFKAATDAVFKARDAISAARDQEFKAHVDARDKLIATLLALNEDTPPVEVRKTISEVDTAWRRAGEAPRNIAAKIDAKFRAARDRARDLVAGSAKRSWSKVCDALDAKIALCITVESGSATNVDDDWNALTSLPVSWEASLSARRSATPKVDDPAASMLKLEAALDLASPPAFQAARQQMKLLAMKQAIEARQAVVISSVDIERWVADAIGAPLADAAANTRLRAILNGLRSRPL
ncbi:MAG: DUF349 domain-containing protein [Rhodocyclaceae bacterium]|nr:DUF349 domain-containing protein [Rhodocyclaceae bacterium]